MEAIINKASWNDEDEQLRNDALRKQRDQALQDDDVIRSDRMTDYRLPKPDEDEESDEDDETFFDDDLNGRDLDSDNQDEWDEANVSNEDLDEDDLMDTDEANFELHQIKNDKFGSLSSSISEDDNPDPDEIPEEQEKDKPEQGEADEVADEKEDEIKPSTENEVSESKPVTLNNLDPTFTNIKHGRKTGRMIDHEPGAPGEI